MPDSPPTGTDPSRGRPLPDCLTRFLSAPAARPIASTPGDRPRASRPPVPPLPVDLALRGAVIWAVLYNLVGFGLLYWVWSTMRVPGP